jgi:hypothetical protein
MQRLYEIIDGLLNARHCQHAERILFRFMQELDKIGASFLDINGPRTSVVELLDNLDKFAYTPDRSCNKCSWFQNLTCHVKRVGDDVDGLISGLCLDCIAIGHGNTNRVCRVTHTEPTWYYSSLAHEHNGQLRQG